jgi:hypothetical protein
MAFVGISTVAGSSFADAESVPQTLLASFVRDNPEKQPGPARISLGFVPARMTLFPPIRIVRPADIPPPKPTKGLAIVFDW